MKSTPKKVYSEQDDPMKVKSSRLPNWHIRKAIKIGKGSFSKGVRESIEQFKEEKQ